MGGNSACCHWNISTPRLFIKRETMSLIHTSILVLAFISYGTYIFLSYSKSARNYKYFYLIALIFPIISNLLWLWGIRMINDTQKIFLFGLSFHLIIALCSLGVPIIFYKVRFTKTKWIGISLITLGFFIIHEV